MKKYVFFWFFSVCALFVQAQARFPVGKPADYTLEMLDMNNKKISLQAYKGKVIILHQWATWCGPCKKEEPALAAFYQQYKNELALIALSEEPLKRVKSYMQKQANGIPYFVSTGKSPIPKAYYSDVVPATFIISKKGEVRLISDGVLDWENEALRKFIEKLLDE